MRPVPPGTVGQEEVTVNLGVDVSERGGWTVVAPLGDIDMASVPALRQEIVRLVSDGHRRIALDLRAVDFVDSVGLGLVLGARKRLRANGGELEIAGVSDPVRAVFELVELDQIFDLHPSLDRLVGDAP